MASGSEGGNRVLIFDTTLRDGEQSPGATMHLPEKLEVAHALRDLGVDVIEAGFPAASPGDFEAVREVARQVEGPIICGLARCHGDDLARAADALRDAPRKRIHVFLATSIIHREHKLRMSKPEIVRLAVEGVARARDVFDDVEFSPEDASRTELDFLAEVVERAVEAGARTINVPDTVGYAVPEHYAAMIRHLKKNVRGVEQVTLSVHCHNDLGLAVANTLAALKEGARQVECTINGIGERAGNCSLEEVVMALRTRKDYFGLETGVHSQRLHPTSRLVSNVTGLHVQRNKAIVGQNAFAHEAGIHQHGMLMHHSTYEIMRPEDVGLSKTDLVLGKHSGRHALRERVSELGYHLDDTQLDKVFADFKALAERKKEIYDSDVEALINGRIQDAEEPWRIIAVQTTAGTGTQPTATVRLRHSDGRVVQEAAWGDGPIDAALAAMARIAEVDVRLVDYQVRSVSVGTDAQGEVSVEVEHRGRVHRGRATSTDIFEASAHAFLNVINRIVLERQPSAAAMLASMRRD
jgi:2-isopropylmalate synthase